jgi:alkanesulfonate monooxygenase SsuD/methylene tetrahydromethanopterin reductase-like flavin-dependent oxidoreductase (luciferase family)
MRHGYERLEEFIDVCRKLWSSVEPDAFVWDAEIGEVADPSKLRAINHAGAFFKVKGPLSVVPSPQGIRSCSRQAVHRAERGPRRVSPITFSAS